MKEYNITARFYELFYDKETVGDAEFWPSMAEKSKGPILELGCGTGRVTFPLAALGHEITGLDNSEPMLAKARGKLATQSPDVKGKVMLCSGDMSDFSLEGKFGLIIVPFRGFQHLLTPEKQEDCLECVRDHLAEGGIFVVTLFNPDIEFLARPGKANKNFQMERVDPETGNTIVRYTRESHDPKNQLIHGKFIYDIYDPEGTLLSSEMDAYTLRWTWRWEMEYLLRLAEFQIEAVYGNYHRVPFPSASRELIFVCAGGA
ncbi:MAG: class I SAM-dependent methyltransferase [Planctomycetota bacterium]|jgi:SAM-dependent methyltransferase